VSRRVNPSFPAAPFGLLLVEGGDERAVCEAVVSGTRWADLRCWYGSGRDDLPNLARLAALDPNSQYARAVGVVLDVEDDPARALALAASALAAFGASGAPVHGVLAGSPRPLGAFFAPDGTSPGSIETLCRQAIRDSRLATCVDALVACAGSPHALPARADKGWLRAYLGMLPDPNLRFHQAFSTADGIDPAHAVFEPLRRFLLAI
jgi:hypothetical protein